jgi:hypothetical protein
MNGRRVLPSLVLLGCVLGFAALWVGGAHGAYFGVLRALGVPVFPFPFLDTHGELAVIECHRRGLDVYVSNPCDTMGRVHVYTPLWFRFAVLPVKTSWTPAVGFGLALAFIGSLLLLPPGRDGRATGLICAGVVSPAVGFGVERGNADLLMFVLVALAAALALRRLPVRLLAFPVVVLAAGLKVYPATALVLALRERPVLCLATGLASVAALLAYAVIDAVGLREMLALVPTGSPFIYAFGARNLSIGLDSAFRWSPMARGGVQAVLLVAAIVFAVRRAGVLRPAVGALVPAEATCLLVGAALILGCFFAGQNGEYRAVHLLFVLPALTALAAGSGPAGRLAQVAVWVVLLQLWGDVVSAPVVHFAGTAGAGLAGAGALLLWLVRELAWWWIVALLLAMVLAMLPDLPSVAAWRRDARR